MNVPHVMINNNYLHILADTISRKRFLLPFLIIVLGKYELRFSDKTTGTEEWPRLVRLQVAASQYLPSCNVLM